VTVKRLTVTRGINGRGAKDLGVLPNVAAGYAAAEPSGRHGREILEAAASGEIQGLVFLGANAALEAAGDLLLSALRKARTVVAIDTHPGVVAKHAHVLIPGHTVFEKLGSVTNLEGRVQRVRPALPAASSTPAETRVLTALAVELGAEGWGAGDPLSVNRALRDALPAYARAGNGGRALFSAVVAA
jgi:NADH-quinone oxidoreductase subunit G